MHLLFSLTAKYLFLRLCCLICRFHPCLHLKTKTKSSTSLLSPFLLPPQQSKSTPISCPTASSSPVNTQTIFKALPFIYLHQNYIQNGVFPIQPPPAPPGHPTACRPLSRPILQPQPHPFLPSAGRTTSGISCPLPNPRGAAM